MTKIDGHQASQTEAPVGAPNRYESLLGNLSDVGPLHAGIDIGSVSCKVAVLDGGKGICYLAYRRTQGRPMETARAMLAELFGRVAPDRIASMVGTGSAGRKLCELLGIDFINELICQAASIRHFHPEAQTLIEMGGQDS